MKFLEVLVCVGFALLSTTNAAAVPSKASLSPKDKLALEIPIKQHLTNKAQGKQEGVKVSYPTTTTTTTETPKPQRPKYVDAAVFRHQFTTAAPPSGPSATAEEQATVVEVSRVTGRDVAGPFAEAFSFPQTATAIIGSSAATAVEPVEDVESYDYEALLALEDLSPFGGELDILGGDARSAAYLSSFRPVGF
ncbi:uncharacterized protein LOC135206693 [Macrobrachium nipponense]|uniref:uncharacterized protein LOC135206693 n=1 Tax=Macrobrachium nipponense TaxID=159736 RepID=UPI0030C7DE7C